MHPHDSAIQRMPHMPRNSVSKDAHAGGRNRAMKILFLAPRIAGGVASFAETDIKLLRELGHAVHVLPWHGRPWVKLAREALWCDVIYCWFVGHHSYLASFFHKPMVVCIGGYDFANLPEYRYGNLRTWFGRRVARRVWKRADAILAVAFSLVLEAEHAMGQELVLYAPTGHDGDYWTPGDGQRPYDVVSVITADTPLRARLKGLDVLYALAYAMPNVEFHVVGTAIPAKDVIQLQLPWPWPPGNVTLHPWMGRDELREMYRKSKVHLQLSRREGMPSSLCEAMLCGCVPAATAVGDTQLIVAGTGEHIFPGDLPWMVANARDAVRSAIQLSRSGAGLHARQRVLTMFNLERRKLFLEVVLEDVRHGIETH